MSALVRFGIPDHVVASEYIASINDETCDNCGTCVQRCQFHARQLINNKLVFNQAKCFGCGLCISTCPTKSITLVKRNELKNKKLKQQAHGKFYRMDNPTIFLCDFKHVN